METNGSLVRKIFSYKNYLSVYLIIILLFNILLINFPLVNVFGYEFSVINSVLLTFLSGFFIISLAKKEEANKYEGFAKNLFSSSLLFLSIPFIVSVLNSLFTRFCSFTDGLLFYAIITFPSIIIGFSIGLFSFFFFKRFRRIFLLVIILIILLIALVEFYFNPQVYFYNPVLGYLPGTIYDEGLTVDIKLVIYRLFNITFFGSLLAGLILHLSGKIKIKKIFFLWWLILVPLFFIILSPSFGYSTTFGKLKSELSNKISTEHFDIYFDEAVNDTLVKLIILHHEYFYNELNDYLDETPSQKIQSFIFKSRNQKKELFGSSNADVAKTWMYSIFTTYDNYNTTLKHEIAHCFSSEFGEGPFQIADMINPFLIEGIAAASDPFYDENDIDYLASVAYKNGFKTNLEKMYKFSSFFTQTSSLSYIYAGSFTKYLIAEYGIEKFKKLYTDLNFQKIYGKSINELENDYFIYLDKFETDNLKDKANYYFGRKSIFFKDCPRFVSDRLETAWNYYRNNEFEKAVELFRYTLEKGEIYSAVIGLANAFAETGRRDSSIMVIKKYLNNFEGTAYQYNLVFNLADLYAEKGNNVSADSLYKQLFEQNPNSATYYLTALRRALYDKYLLEDYLAGNDSVKYSILKKLNNKKYYYSSFPVIVNLSKFLSEDYTAFLKQFDRTLIVNNYLSSYSIFILSEYMMENLDFNRARRTAALSLRFKEDGNLNLLLNENLQKIKWFNQNAERILNEITYLQK